VGVCTLIDCVGVGEITEKSQKEKQRERGKWTIWKRQQGTVLPLPPVVPVSGDCTGHSCRYPSLELTVSTLTVWVDKLPCCGWRLSRVVRSRTDTLMRKSLREFLSLLTDTRLVVRHLVCAVLCSLLMLAAVFNPILHKWYVLVA